LIYEEEVEELISLAQETGDKLSGGNAEKLV